MHCFARSGDATIAYSVSGEGKPLVLLHGFGLSGADWEGAGYAEPLRASGHRLVVIDLRGHGASSKPHDPEAYLPAAEVADIIAVLDSLAIERADFVGYSRGGRLALEVATMFPGRIRKLAVGGTHPYAQDMRLYRVAVSRGIEGWIEVIEKIGGPLPAPARQRIALGDVHALRAAVALDRPDISMKLTDKTRSCLFYAGACDPLSAHAQRAASEMCGGEFVQIDGRNHISAWRCSDRVLPHVQSWLASADNTAI